MKKSGKRGTGKRKGGGYEIVVSRLLTKWFSGEERPELFWRTASSGAKATLSRKAGHKSRMQGDIMPIDESTMFLDKLFIETKFYKDIRLDLLLCLERACLIRTWWIKCEEEAHDVDKVPWLIMRRNNMNDMIVVPDLFIEEIEKWSGRVPHCIRFNVEETPLSLFLLKDFLSWFTPEIAEAIFVRTTNSKKLSIS